MTTVTMPYRPQVDFFTKQCFSVQYGDKNTPLECWQKVLIIALGILLVGIGGLALSYYWRDRLVQQLYDADYQRVNKNEINSSDAPPKTERTQEEQQRTQSFAMPANISNVIKQIKPFPTFLTQISPHTYVDAQKTRLFCFNEEQAKQILIAQFLFDAIPPGIYFVVSASSDRIAEKVNETLYRSLAELVGDDTVIDLIIGHYAVTWSMISNPKSVNKPFFKPARICQILYNEMNAKPEMWEDIYFEDKFRARSTERVHLHHPISDTITKFTETWVDKSQDAANKKRRQAVQTVISRLQCAVTADGQPVKI